MLNDMKMFLECALYILTVDSLLVLQFPRALRDGALHLLPAGAGGLCLRTALPEALHVPKPVAITRHPLCQDGPALCAHGD